MMTAARLAIVAALFGSAAIPAFAQMDLGVIQGTVKDEAGQPLEGVVIRLKDATRGRETELKTDKAGKFYRRGLPAVEYELAVEKAGYNPIHDNVKLSAGVDKRYDFKLVKGAPEGAEEFSRGVAAFNRGDNQGAVEAFEATLRKSDLPEVHVNLALAYMRLSRRAEAVEHLEKARVLAPDKPGVLFQLGEAYIETQQYDNAIAAIEGGLAKTPSATDPIALDGTVTLGAVYFAKGDNDKAITAFEKVLSLKPDAAPARLGAAKAYFSKGDVAKALEYFKQVVATSPGTAEAKEADTFVKAIEKPKPDAAWH